jgi:hypothetical protein
MVHYRIGEAPDSGLHGLHSTLLVETADRLSGRDYALSNIRDSIIHLRGNMGALRISDVKNCLIYAGPVGGATFVDGKAKSICIVILTAELLIYTTSLAD